MGNTGKNVAISESSQPTSDKEITQTNDNNNHQPIVNSVDIVEVAEKVIESNPKIHDKSLTPDNVTVTVTYILFLFSLFFLFFS